jgi:hypothetical protein
MGCLDIIANAWALLFVSQELLWKEQRITPKFSFHTTQCPVQTQCFREFRNKLDYNGQTYWLSVNLHSFYIKIPKWLNLLGYGANGMLTGNGENNGLF